MCFFEFIVLNLRQLAIGSTGNQRIPLVNAYGDPSRERHRPCVVRVDPIRIGSVQVLVREAN
jgi:hypothetical protein